MPTQITRSDVNVWGGAWNFDLEFIVYFFLILLALLALGGFFVWVFTEGPLVLIETALEATLATSVSVAALRAEKPDWRGNLFWRTIFPFLFFWFLSFVIVGMIDGACPGHSRISEIASACWFK